MLLFVSYLQFFRFLNSFRCKVTVNRKKRGIISLNVFQKTTFFVYFKFNNGLTVAIFCNYAEIFPNCLQIIQTNIERYAFLPPFYKKQFSFFSNIFNQCVTLKRKTHNTLNMLHLRQLCYCLMAITFCSFTNKGAAENFPKQYIVFSMPDYEDTAIYQIAHEYGGYQGGKIAVAAGLNLSYLSQKENEVKARVEYVLTASEKLNIRILMELEGINYWQAYPELWNWWDFSSAGYNPDNRKNVEWFSWSPDSATKIGWRNWGRQFRLLPMPNLSSPAYRHVAFGVLKNILDII